MTKSGIYVRAKDKDGKWNAIDILELDEDQWRLWVTEKLKELGSAIFETKERGE